MEIFLEKLRKRKIKKSSDSEYMKRMNPELQPENWGKRADGTPKGLGYFGILQRPGGGISTELTMNIDGRDMPLLVPTLNKNEVDSLLRGEKPTKEIIRKAVEHAHKRIAEGKSVYAQEGEQQ